MLVRSEDEGTSDRQKGNMRKILMVGGEYAGFYKDTGSG